jgi:hypothetical protein
MALERAGWKGRAGSALASAEGTSALFSSVIRSAHARNSIEFSALRLDGNALAMLVTLIDGRAGFSYKTAFDEDYARYSPGVLLQRESLKLLADRSLDWIDSCAAPDHPMIDSLWRERRGIVSLSLPLPGATNRAIFAMAQCAKSAWHAMKQNRTGVTPPTEEAQN